MPFKSEKQRKYCWYLYSKAEKEGTPIKWDCEEWEKETKKQGGIKKKKIQKKKKSKSKRKN